MKKSRIWRAFKLLVLIGLGLAALLLGVESRTSSPVRVPRDPGTLEYVSLPGIFPCGEGAGYAGGIVSSALDGINVAEAVARSLKPAEA